MALTDELIDNAITARNVSSRGRALPFCYFLVSDYESQAGHVLTNQSSNDFWQEAITRDTVYLAVSTVPTLGVTMPGNINAAWALPYSDQRCAFTNPIAYIGSAQAIFGYVEESSNTVTESDVPFMLSPLERDARSLLKSFLTRSFDTDLSYELTDVLKDKIKLHGTSYIDTIESLIVQQNVKPQLASEALVALGRIAHPDTQAQRFNILVKMLEQPAAIVRDGAVIGLSLLDVLDAIPYLRKAMAREKLAMLKENIQIAIADIERQ
jgi:hypothetical protein